MFVGTDRAPPYGQGRTLDNRGTRSYGESVFQLHALYRARTSLWQERTLGMRPDRRITHTYRFRKEQPVEETSGQRSRQANLSGI